MSQDDVERRALRSLREQPGELSAFRRYRRELIRQGRLEPDPRESHERARDLRLRHQGLSGRLARLQAVENREPGERGNWAAELALRTSAQADEVARALARLREDPWRRRIMEERTRRRASSRCDCGCPRGAHNHPLEGACTRCSCTRFSPPGREEALEDEEDQDWLQAIAQGRSEWTLGVTSQAGTLDRQATGSLGPLAQALVHDLARIPGVTAVRWRPPRTREDRNVALRGPGGWFAHEATCWVLRTRGAGLLADAHECREEEPQAGVDWLEAIASRGQRGVPGYEAGARVNPRNDEIEHAQYGVHTESARIVARLQDLACSPGVQGARFRQEHRGNVGSVWILTLRGDWVEHAANCLALGHSPTGDHPGRFDRAHTCYPGPG